jgi:SAM-dependent methyltransferase
LILGYFDVPAITGKRETQLDLVIPPPEIRSRIVSTSHSEEEYRRIGQGGAEAILSTLKLHTDLSKREAVILDFGCGCSRVLQPIHSLCPQWTLIGTDIDDQAIFWNRTNITYAAFDMNTPIPPLRYNNGFFDLIYAMSVFSHLNEDMEVAWLTELVRVLKKSGHLYITFNSQHVLNQIPQSFPEEAVSAYERNGFAYFCNIDDGILPEWYQTSLQSYEFLKSRLPGNSSVMSHESGGCLGWQDSMLIRRSEA